MLRKSLFCIVLALASASAFAVPNDIASPPQAAGLMPGSATLVGGGGPVVNPFAVTTLWDNLPLAGESVTSTGSVPRTGGADEMLFNGPGATITSMQFGYLVAAGGPAAFDARVQFFDDIDFTAGAGVPQFANLVSQFTVAFTGQVAGAFLTAPINLTGLPGGGVTVTNNAANLGDPNLTDCYMTLQFFQPGTTTPVANNLVTYLFRAGGAEPNTGFTFGSAALGGTQLDEVYWRDANANLTITGDEARSFAAPTRANWTVHLDGQLVPEPGSLTLLYIGGAALMARRRR
jgi:hypothetical protein